MHQKHLLDLTNAFFTMLPEVVLPDLVPSDFVDLFELNKQKSHFDPLFAQMPILLSLESVLLPHFLLLSDVFPLVQEEEVILILKVLEVLLPLLTSEPFLLVLFPLSVDH